MKINTKKDQDNEIVQKCRRGDKHYDQWKSDTAVESFNYLVSTMTDGRCEPEIKVRIALAKEAFSERRELLTKPFRKKVKKNIVNTLVWSTLLYGSETWTLRKEDIRRLEAVEMWMWRRMEKVSWMDKITNEEILNKVGEK